MPKKSALASKYPRLADIYNKLEKQNTAIYEREQQLASVEKEFDTIAEGKMDWTKAIDKFYKVFHPIVEATATTRTEHRLGERHLGADPATGEPVYVKIGRFGPMAQIGDAHALEEKGEKPRFATLQGTIH